MNLLDSAIRATTEYIEHMPKSQRKKYGQFFTSKKTAIFMAELFEINNKIQEVSILDPGAGSGVLSIALLERLQTFTTIKKIQLVCYENDPNIIELLQSNLEMVCSQSSQKISYKIISDNYILSQAINYNNKLNAELDTNKYDFIIGNPPYMKIAKDSPEVLAMSDVCYGAPNLYFLFASMSMFNLKENGELVYIIPRSWTSGAYFKKFRQKFLNEGVLEHIHLFVSRNKVFEKEKVLQETIIIKSKKTNIKPKTLTITTTQSNADFYHKTIFKAPYSTVVNKADSYVYLVTNSDEIDVLNNLNKWNDTLLSIGLKMKTGLTVDFRNKDSLRNKIEEKAVPLFYSQHIQNGKVVFPIGKEHEYLVTNQRGLLQSNKNYLFIKRFTAKEEHRRLQCGVYLAKKFPEYSNISTQNKINFIDGIHELSECIVYGLYVLFNSTLYDCYYRILNGSTQVNSTEINSMPVPPIDIIETMGKDLIAAHNMSETMCDSILRGYL